jgi:enamine deaminase RidA (YjgF/YER057c/UK114 family)
MIYRSTRLTQLFAVITVVLIVGTLVSPCKAQTVTGAIRFVNPTDLPKPRGYSHVAEVPPGSRLVYISGQIAADSTGNIVGQGDFRGQAVQVFENLRRALAAVGGTFADVVKLDFYVLDITQVAVLREVRDRYVNTTTPPASTLVEVRRLVRDEFLLEIDAVAAVPVR